MSKHATTPPSFATLVQAYFAEYLPQQRALSPQTIAAYRDAYADCGAQGTAFDQPRCENQSARAPCRAISGLPLRALTISQARQVIGMRMPRPMALEKASLAEKRVAR